MMAYYYLKLHHEILHDPKMGLLSDHLYRRVIELFLMASERQERDGYLPQLDVMAWTLHVSPADLLKDLRDIEAQTGIVSEVEPGRWLVTNFIKRQASTDPTAPERMKRYRERNENATDNKNVTRNVTRTDEEKLRVELRVKNLEEDREGEIKKAAATSHPSLPAETDLLHYWTITTGMMTFPAISYASDLNRLAAIYSTHRGAIVEYLRPFWDEWNKRNYSKSNTAWLDWAVAGQIPERKTEPRNNNGLKPGVAATIAELEKRRANNG